MEAKTKECSYCKRAFQTHDKTRIVLEYWRAPKQLARKYFCCKKCFVSFLKERKLVE